MVHSYPAVLPWPLGVLARETGEPETRAPTGARRGSAEVLAAGATDVARVAEDVAAGAAGAADALTLVTPTPTPAASAAEATADKTRTANCERMSIPSVEQA